MCVSVFIMWCGCERLSRFLLLMYKQDSLFLTLFQSVMACSKVIRTYSLY
eukprot:m.230302 g.230302  ORF g.230302 m.230302 type:complete len:50 (-) comp17976_c0_seq1:117-266(-)